MCRKSDEISGSRRCVMEEEGEDQEESFAILLDFMGQLSPLLCPTTRPALVSTSAGVSVDTVPRTSFFGRGPSACFALLASLFFFPYLFPTRNKHLTSKAPSYLSLTYLWTIVTSISGDSRPRSIVALRIPQQIAFLLAESCFEIRSRIE